MPMKSKEMTKMEAFCKAYCLDKNPLGVAALAVEQEAVQSYIPFPLVL